MVISSHIHEVRVLTIIRVHRTQKKWKHLHCFHQVISAPRYSLYFNISLAEGWQNRFQVLGTVFRNFCLEPLILNPIGVHSYTVVLYLLPKTSIWWQGTKLQIMSKSTLDYPIYMCQGAFDNNSESFKSYSTGGGGGGSSGTPCIHTVCCIVGPHDETRGNCCCDMLYLAQFLIEMCFLNIALD